MSELGFDSRYHLSGLSKTSINNKEVDFAKVLSETNDILSDMPILPSNDLLSYTGVRETSLPTPQIVKVGDGWDPSTVNWDSFTETLSMFKDRVQIPEDALRIQPDPVLKRLRIQSRHIEGFGQGVSNHLIYGTSVATPEKFDGFNVRYTTPSTANDGKTLTNSASYGVYDMEGTGSDTTSIWFVQWSPEKVHGLYPVNDPNMGIKVEDMGRHLYTAENSKQRWDYYTELQWDLGLTIPDIRAVKRLRNIETSLANINTDLPKRIIQIRNDFYGNETVWMYCNRTMFTHIDILTMDKQNVQYSTNNPYGKPLLMFRDMPVRRCDSISDAETAVTAV